MTRRFKDQPVDTRWRSGSIEANERRQMGRDKAEEVVLEVIQEEKQPVEISEISKKLSERLSSQQGDSAILRLLARRKLSLTKDLRLAAVVG